MPRIAGFHWRAGSPEQEVNSSHKRATVNVITTAGPARLIASARMIQGLLREGTPCHTLTRSVSAGEP